MGAVVNFPGSVSCQAIHSDIPKWLAQRSLPQQKTCNFRSDKMEIQLRLYSKRKVQDKHWDNRRVSAMASNKDPNSGPDSISPSGTAEQFYTFINEKKLRQLGGCISNDAYFEDYSFPKPFQGKKEVMQFLEQLTASMGQNVKFKVGDICEGEDFTAAVKWHLEWKKTQIPFTRGCSFFKCSKDGEHIIIRKANVLIESPIKPGGIVLALFKTVTSLFDDFPKATEWFLKSPHAVLKWVMNMYNIFMAPLLNPLLGGYIKFWSLIARLLGYAFNIAIFISKFFIK